jgi:hypothetical protein
MPDRGARLMNDKGHMGNHNMGNHNRVTTMLIRLRIVKLLRTPATIAVVPATSEVAVKVVYLPLSYASKEDSGES